MTSVPVNSYNKLHSDLQKVLDTIREKKAFNPEEFIKVRCSEFMRYLNKFNISTVVLSVSGGVDSASVLGLLKNAQDMANLVPTHPFNVKNGGKIIPIAQPIHSTPSIQNRAYKVCEAFNVPCVTIDQTDIYDKLCKQINDNMSSGLTPFSASMLKSYMRTPVAYAIASSNKGVVIGTGNLDEDGYLYYYCKFGDGAVDIGLIWDLHKSEVFTLAKYMGVPESILIAPPSADLAPGQTDESEIGVTYDMVELIYNYLYNFSQEEKDKFISSLSSDALEQFNKEKVIVDAIHKRGSHKADLNPKNIGKYEF